jgi:uncharacterized protein (DUF697 family)
MKEVQDKTAQAEKMLKKYVWGSAGFGLLPCMLADLAGVTALQMKLVHALAALYEVEFSEQRVKALISALLGSSASAAYASKLTSLLKLLPISAPFAMLSSSGMNAATTYAVGKVFILHFATGGTLLNFDPKAMQDYFFEQLSAQAASVTAEADSAAPASYAGIKP